MSSFSTDPPPRRTRTRSSSPWPTFRGKRYKYEDDDFNDTEAFDQSSKQNIGTEQLVSFLLTTLLISYASKMQLFDVFFLQVLILSIYLNLKEQPSNFFDKFCIMSLKDLTQQLLIELKNAKEKLNFFQMDAIQEWHNCDSQNNKSENPKTENPKYIPNCHSLVELYNGLQREPSVQFRRSRSWRRKMKIKNLLPLKNLFLDFFSHPDF